MRERVGVILTAVAVVVALLFAASGGIATAQTLTTSPAAAHPIHRSDASAPSAGSPSADSGGGGWQVAFSLAAVLALIVVLYWVSRRILPGSALAKASSSRAIQILARTPLGPKHRILLVQIGRRIVVVAESTGQPLTTLCQITDPNEAAALIGQLGGDQRGAMAAFLEKATNPIQSQTGATVDSSDLATTRQELDGLLQQVRSMSQQIGRA